MTHYLLIIIVTIFTVASYASDLPYSCYKQVYSEAHMKSHPQQTLKSLIITMANDNSYINIDGVSAANSLEYAFNGSTKVENLICADLATEGFEDNGCVQVEKTSDGNLRIIPAGYTIYEVDGLKMSANGLTLRRCAGPSNETEGCLNQKIKTIHLSPNNIQDSYYFLKNINCSLL